MGGKRTPEQRRNEAENRKRRMSEDPTFREHKRKLGREAAARFRKNHPGAHAAIMRSARAKGADGVGKIYFFRSGTAIKIGFTTKTIEARLAQLQPGNPLPITILGWMPGTRLDETVLHDRFKASRLLGEWFQETPELLQLCTTTASSGEISRSGPSAPS